MQFSSGPLAAALRFPRMGEWVERRKAALLNRCRRSDESEIGAMRRRTRRCLAPTGPCSPGSGFAAIRATGLRQRTTVEPIATEPASSDWCDTSCPSSACPTRGRCGVPMFIPLSFRWFPRARAMRKTLSSSSISPGSAAWLSARLRSICSSATASAAFGWTGPQARSAGAPYFPAIWLQASRPRGRRS